MTPLRLWLDSLLPHIRRAHRDGVAFAFPFDSLMLLPGSAGEWRPGQPLKGLAWFRRAHGFRTDFARGRCGGPFRVLIYPGEAPKP